MLSLAVTVGNAAAPAVDLQAVAAGGPVVAGRVMTADSFAVVEPDCIEASALAGHVHR